MPCEEGEVHSPFVLNQCFVNRDLSPERRNKWKEKEGENWEECGPE